MSAGRRSCRCRRGFEGHRCQNAEVTCGHGVCRNNGTCRRDGGNIRCLCRPGFKGDWCEVEMAECQSNPCKHGTYPLLNPSPFTFPMKQSSVACAFTTRERLSSLEKIFIFSFVKLVNLNNTNKKVEFTTYQTVVMATECGRIFFFFFKKAVSHALFASIPLLFQSIFNNNLGKWHLHVCSILLRRVTTPS